MGRSAASPLLVLSLLAGACSTSSTTVETILFTDVHVKPASFLGARACGRTDGSVQSYVVTYYEVPDDAPTPSGDLDCSWSLVTPAIKRIGATPPVPCGLDAAFGDVVPGSRYVAAIDAYPLPPCAYVSDAACIEVDPSDAEGRTLIRKDTGAVVVALPEDKTCCGYPTPRPTEGPDPHATTAVYLVRREMIDCHPLEASAGVGSIRVRTSTIQGLTCGDGAGQASKVKVTGTQGGETTVACGADAKLSGISGTVVATATALSKDGAVVGAATCKAAVGSAIEYVAACDPLVTTGGLTVRAKDVCGSATSYSVKVVGVGQKDAVPCTDDATFTGLAPASYTAVVTVDGGTRVCTAQVGPAVVTVASCPSP